MKADFWISSLFSIHMTFSIGKPNYYEKTKYFWYFDLKKQKTEKKNWKSVFISLLEIYSWFQNCLCLYSCIINDWVLYFWRKISRGFQESQKHKWYMYICLMYVNTLIQICQIWQICDYTWSKLFLWHFNIFVSFSITFSMTTMTDINVPNHAEMTILVGLWRNLHVICKIRK